MGLTGTGGPWQRRHAGWPDEQRVDGAPHVAPMLAEQITVPVGEYHRGQYAQR